MSSNFELLGIKYEDGFYEYDGCQYEKGFEVLSIGVLKFCGCGRPEDAVAYVRDGLRIILEHWSNGSYEEWVEQKAKHFRTPGAEYFFYYVATELDLLEHGGSVPGWLTEKGEAFLELVDEALREEEAE